MKRTRYPLDDHLMVIRKVAWLMHRRSGLPFDDLFSEGCLQYLLRMDRFYKRYGKAKYTSYLWTTIWTALVSYAIEQSSHPTTELTNEIISTLGSPPIRPKIKKVPLKEKFTCGKYQMF